MRYMNVNVQSLIKFVGRIQNGSYMEPNILIQKLN